MCGLPEEAVGAKPLTLVLVICILQGHGHWIILVPGKPMGPKLTHGDHGKEINLCGIKALYGGGTCYSA